MFKSWYVRDVQFTAYVIYLDACLRRIRFCVCVCMCVIFNSWAAEAGLSAPTSTGLSGYMLDTYNTGGLVVGVGAATGADDQGRPPRYGAFVFGDRIPVNVSVDWDSLRENPEILSAALETVGDDLIPADGGEVDLQVGSTSGLRVAIEYGGCDGHDHAESRCCCRRCHMIAIACGAMLSRVFSDVVKIL